MEGLKHGLDATAAASVVAAWLNVLPAVLAGVASALSIVWYAIRIWEWWRARRVK